MKIIYHPILIFLFTSSTLFSYGQQGEGGIDTLMRQWTFQTGGPIYGSPIGYKNNLLIGSADSTLYSLNKKTGKLNWKLDVSGQIRSAICREGDIIYFHSSSGEFYAVNAVNGDILWKYDVGDPERKFDHWDYFLSAPLYLNGKICFGSSDGHLHALDASTGKLIWKFKTDGMVHSSPSASDNTIFFGSYDGYFYALNLDGSLKWKFKTIGETYFPNGEIQYHAVIKDSTVYFTSRDYNVYALDVKTGAGRWVYHEIGSWSMVPVVAGNQLIFGTSDTHKIKSLSAGSGRLKWEVDVRLNVYGGISIVDSMAYAGVADGRLLKININSGEVLSQFQTTRSIQNEDEFFTEEGQLKVKDLVDKYDGDIYKIYDAFFELGSILSTPWVDDELVYFGDMDGVVHAVKR
ncbi:MAG: PQQ-binding-like beta-propeller repeat protein [Ekhidna sp.]|uniref:PQQ-binding-like beta-propeller repeat protein n=1 Tax=Ekhidna sp. TaxID=2608089 RepID=UPI0032ED8BEB